MPSFIPVRWSQLLNQNLFKSTSVLCCSSQLRAGGMAGGEAASCSSCCSEEGRKDLFWLLFNKVKEMGCELIAHSLFFFSVFAGHQQTAAAELGEEGCRRFFLSADRPTLLGSEGQETAEIIGGSGGAGRHSKKSTIKQKGEKSGEGKSRKEQRVRQSRIEQNGVNVCRVEWNGVQQSREEQSRMEKI